MLSYTELYMYLITVIVHLKIKMSVYVLVCVCVCVCLCVLQDSLNISGTRPGTSGREDDLQCHCYRRLGLLTGQRTPTIVHTLTYMMCAKLLGSPDEVVT